MKQELRPEQTVQSAEGALYRIGYVDLATRTATLSLLDERTGRYVSNAQLVTLPLEELRRVPDPTKARPPIEGMPADRPRCPYCDRKLAPVVHEERVDGYGSRIIRRTWVRWRAKRQLFCTLSCALDFAVACHKAGYRIKRGK